MRTPRVTGAAWIVDASLSSAGSVVSFYSPSLSGWDVPAFMIVPHDEWDLLMPMNLAACEPWETTQPPTPRISSAGTKGACQ